MKAVIEIVLLKGCHGGCQRPKYCVSLLKMKAVSLRIFWTWLLIVFEALFSVYFVLFICSYQQLKDET